jgi:acetyl-CoA carboxylase carboxyltransferase component
MYHTIERALEMKVPLIGLHDSPGFRVIRPEAGSTDLVGGTGLPTVEKSGVSVFYPNTQASGVIPQISAILGSCAGISVYSPALTDFIFMVDGTSHMFITGPRIVKSIMGEEISMEELGGAKVHSKVSGVADFRVGSEEECLQRIRKLLSFLPSNNEEKPPIVDTGDDPERVDEALAEIVPVDARKSYDVRKVVTHLVDNGDFFEVKAEFAPEIVVGFGRLAGQSVGIVANQPMVRAGSLTIDSSDKQARFMRFCDAFNLPLILLVDTSAYMPGLYQEHSGIIRHGAKVLYALCEAVVPRIVVILRKCYGGGNLGMSTLPGFRTDFIFHWPLAEAGVLGADQSVDLFYSKDVAEAADPVKYKEEKVKEYQEQYANPFFEASNNPYIDDVINPKETRKVLIRALQLLRNKKVFRQPKRHGNIPL